MPIIVLADHIGLVISFGIAALLFSAIILEHGHRPVFLTVLVGIVLLLMQAFTTTDVFSYIWKNPLNTAIAVAGYFLIAVGYVWVKWFSFVHIAARKYHAWMAENANSNASVSDLQRQAARELGYRTLPLKVSSYKAMIFGWMMYWPLSAAWTLLNDPVARAFNFIYYRIAGSLQKMSDRAFLSN